MEEEGSDGKCPQKEQSTGRWGKRQEEVCSRNNQRQKVGGEPPAAGDPDGAGEGGGRRSRGGRVGRCLHPRGPSGTASSPETLVSLTRKEHRPDRAKEPCWAVSPEAFSHGRNSGSFRPGPVLQRCSPTRERL